MSDDDAVRLARALALANKSRGYVEPGAPVGCVVVREGRVVGEGWYKAWGGSHAEVEALNIAGDQAKGATLYVSLEPCSRVGKTPACTDRIIASCVARVVFAAQDPHPDQAGRAVSILKDAGIAVEGPAAPDAGAALLARFIRSIRSDRPWVIAKWAMSLDGRITHGRNQRAAINGRKSRLLAHIHRGRMDAIAVGAQTVRVDDPQLTCRLEGGPPDRRAQPLRVVFTTSFDIPADSVLVETADKIPTVIFGNPTHEVPVLLAQSAAECVPCADLNAALGILRARGIERLLLEGGSQIHGAFFDAKLVDQVSAYIAPTVIGGSDPIVPILGAGVMDMSQALQLEDVTWRKVGDDLFLNGFVPHDAVLHDAEPHDAQSQDSQ